MPDQEDITPNLASTVAQQGVADAAGGIAYSGVADAEAAGEIAFQGPTADSIYYNIVNGVFAQPPPDPTQNIEPVNNPLPYWSGPIQVSGGAITCQWVADPASPSGSNLRLSLAAGAVDDEAYVEQTVQIGGARDRVFAVALRSTFVNNGATTLTYTAEAQFLTVSGTTTGSAATSSATLAAGVTATPYAVLESPPADAYYVRVRIGLTRGAAAVGTSGALDVASVRLERTMGRLRVPEEASPSTWDSGNIRQSSGLLTVEGQEGLSLRAGSAGSGDIQIQKAGDTFVWALFDYSAYALKFLDPATGNSLGRYGQRQVKTGTTGSITGGAGVDVTVTWDTAFTSTSYTVLMSFELNDATARNDTPNWYVRTDASQKTTSSCVVRVYNGASVALNFSYRAIGWHDAVVL